MTKIIVKITSASTFLLDDASFSHYGVLGVLLLTSVVTVTILVCLVIRRQRKISPSVEGG